MCVHDGIEFNAIKQKDHPYIYEQHIALGVSFSMNYIYMYVCNVLYIFIYTPYENNVNV